MTRMFVWKGELIGRDFLFGTYSYFCVIMFCVINHQITITGNSFVPHLHFQFMDRFDIAIVNGLPCAFEEYEVLRKGEWVSIKAGIPTNKERIRFEEA